MLHAVTMLSSVTIFDGGSISTIGPAGLVVIAVLMLLSGRLVPRPSLEDAQHERDLWRAAYMLSEQGRADSVRQVEKLLEHGQTTEALLQTIAAAAQGRREPA